MIRPRWQQALAAGLVAHAITSLCALCAALPFADSVAAPPSAADTASVAALVTLLRLGSSALRHPWRYAAWPLATTLICAPLLSMFWLHANQTVDRLAHYAHAAVGEYGRSAALWAICSAYMLGLGLAAAGVTWGVHTALARVDDARLQSVAAMCAAAPFALALVYPITLLDAARATLALGAPTVRAALHAGRLLIDLRLLMIRVGFALVGLCLMAFGLAAPRLLLGSGGVGALCVGQLCGLAGCALRGLWLAILVERSHQLLRA